MAIGYIALLAKLTERFNRWLIWPVLERVGKMALSCYVLQNVLASVIFYGWGFGLGGSVGSFGTVAAWLLICLSLMLFTSIWLSLFKQGPLEASRKFIVRRLSAKERNHDSKTIST
ncbi:DUF418 domain-containing protein [Paenibacillus sp. DMB20]|uniref:DUF418 domain-containing protein n=1 Tax=Paenibacillus sp. DMB20 TaxID=1642570 RepID=UPI002E1672EE